MSIKKSEVQSVVIKRLRGLGVMSPPNDIDEEIRSVLYDVSSRDDFLKTSGTITTWMTATNTADGAPIYSTITGESTITAPTATFYPSMVGKAIAFTATENSYVITAYTSSTVIKVSGDASGESDGDTITVTADGSYGLGVNFKRSLEIAISAGNHLDLITPGEYQDYIEGESSPSTGEPEEYVILDGAVCSVIYLKPHPDGVYTINLDYSYYHPNDLTNIRFSERFRECIYNGVLVLLWLGQLSQIQGSPEHAAKYMQLYESEIAKRKNNLRRQPAFTKYRDL